MKKEDAFMFWALWLAFLLLVSFILMLVTSTNASLNHELKCEVINEEKQIKVCE